MSLIDVHSAATAGIADALIAVEAMRTAILLMIELHRASWYEDSYSSAGLYSIARESFRVPLVVAAHKPWLRKDGSDPSERQRLDGRRHQRQSTADAVDCTSS